MSKFFYFLFVGLILSAAGCSHLAEQQDYAKHLNSIGDRFYKLYYTINPLSEPGYYPDFDVSDKFSVNDAGTLKKYYDALDKLSIELNSIDDSKLSAEERSLASLLRFHISSSSELRVCKSYLWEMNALSGLPGMLDRAFKLMSMKDSVKTEKSFSRAKGIITYVKNEITNLKTGIKDGYLAAEPLVNKRVKKIEKLLSPDNRSFMFEPASNASAAVKAKWNSLITDQLIPALKAYQTFLHDDYEKYARDKEHTSIYYLKNPEVAKKCYAAMIYKRNSSQDSIQSLLDYAERKRIEVQPKFDAYFMKKYGVKGYGPARRALSRLKSDVLPDSVDPIQEANRLLEIGRQFATDKLVHQLPNKPLDILQTPSFLSGTAMGARYQNNTNNPDKPSVFYMDFTKGKPVHLGRLEVTVFHEGLPGHHMFYSFQSMSRDLHPVQRKLIGAMNEGWAVYATSLIQQSPASSEYAPGFYWNQEYNMIASVEWEMNFNGKGMLFSDAVNKMEAYGFTRKFAESLLIRFASMPAQSLTYSLGTWKIRDVENEIASKLGKSFDRKCFVENFLRYGNVPISDLKPVLEPLVLKHCTQ